MEQDCRAPPSPLGQCYHKLMREFNVDCIKQVGRNSCSVTNNCLWITSKQMCVVDAALITATSCEDPCVVSAMNTSFAFQSIEQNMMTWCMRINGRVCYGPLAATGILIEPENTYTLQAVCSSDFNYQCYSRLTERTANWDRVEAQQTFIDCMKTNSSGALFHCGMNLNTSLKQLETLLRRPRHYCSRSTTGQWCYQYNKSRPITVDCEPSHWPQGPTVCPEACNSQWLLLYQSIDCCLATLHKMDQRPTVPSDLIPIVPNAERAWAVTRERDPPWTTMESVATCRSLVGHKVAILQFPCPLPNITAPVSDCATTEVLLALQVVREHCGVTSNDTLFGNGTAMGAVDLEEVCMSRCAQQVPAFNKFRRCFPHTLFRHMTEITAMCALGDHRVRCGMFVKTVIDSIGTGGPQCGTYSTSASCGAVPQCQWFATGLDSGCRHLPSNETIQSVCNNCTRLLVEALPLFSALQAGKLYRSMCIMDGPHLCFPIAAPYFYGRSQFGVHPSTLQYMCENSTVGNRCLRKLYMHHASNLIANATSQIATCVKMNSVAGEGSGGNQAAVVQCITQARDTLGTAERMMMLTETMCLRNTHRWCLSALSELEATPVGAACLPMVTSRWTPPTCSDPCSNFWNALLSNTSQYSCCFGTLHQVLMRGYYIRTTDFPTGLSQVNSTAGSELPPSFQPPPLLVNEVFLPFIGSNGLLNLQVCANRSLSALMNLTHVGCARVRTLTAVAQRLPLPIAFSVIRSNLVLLSRLVATLVNDVAAQLGISPSDIENATLVENTAVQVQVRVEGTKHVFRSLASTSSGTSFTFNIRSDTDDATATAASTLKSLVSSGEMNLDSSAAILSSDCPTCLAAGATTLSSSMDMVVGVVGTEPPSSAPVGVRANRESQSAATGMSSAAVTGTAVGVSLFVVLVVSIVLVYVCRQKRKKAVVHVQDDCVDGVVGDFDNLEKVVRPPVVVEEGDHPDEIDVSSPVVVGEFSPMEDVYQNYYSHPVYDVDLFTKQDVYRNPSCPSDDAVEDEGDFTTQISSRLGVPQNDKIIFE